MNVTSIVLYAGYCTLCSGFVQFLTARDKNEEFSFIPTQSNEGRALIESFNLSRAASDTVLLIEAGMIYQRSAASQLILQ